MRTSATGRRRRRLYVGAVALLVSPGVLAVTTTPSATAADDAPLAPIELTVNDRARPLNVEGVPQFGWLPQDVNGNERQTAYQIVVSDADGDVVWDSGKVASSEQQYVDYGGPSLASGSAYRWTVRTWDKTDQASPYATPAEFETGIDITEWEGAAWIRRPTTEPNDYTLARKEVMVGESPVVRARAYTSAYHQYRLYLNGVEVDDGPAFSYPGEGYYQAADVTAEVKAGEPLVIGVIYQWYGGGQGRPSASAERGMLHKLVIEHADGSRQVIVSDSSWRVRRASQWETLTIRRNGDAGDYIERIDARAEPVGWDRPGYDDSASPWVNAVVVGIPPFGNITRLIGQEPRLAKTVVHPVSITTLSDGAVVADFGVVIPARPVIQFHNGVSGRQINIQTSYRLGPDGEHVGTGTNDTQGSNMSLRYTQRGGEERFVPFLHFAWRYLQINSPGPGEELTTDDISAIVEHTDAPAHRAAEFTSSDQTLNEVWELLQRSGIYSVQHQFVDTPTREKGQFLGDSVDISYSTMLANGERDSTQKAIREFTYSQDRYWNSGNDLGRYNAVYPNGDGKRDIPDYTEMFVNWVYEYYRQTGDIDLVAEVYPYLRNTADYVWRHVATTGPTAGLVVNLSGGSGQYLFGIVDWPASGRFGYDMSQGARTTVNMLGYEVLRRTAELGEIVGRPATEIDLYRTRAADLRDAINSKLRRPDGIYVDVLRTDGTLSEHAGQHPNSYAIAFQVAPEEDYELLANYIAGMGMRQGPMTAHWLLQALADADRPGAVFSLLTNEEDNGWANILARGGTFTWESWNPTGSESYSHGWGSQASVDIIGTMLGLRIASPGAAEVEIVVPRDFLVDRSGEQVGLSWASGTVHTQRGPVSVAWERTENGGLNLHIDVPVNVRATVSLPQIDGMKFKGAGAGQPVFLGVDDGREIFKVGSGTTNFTTVPAHAGGPR